MTISLKQYLTNSLFEGFFEPLQEEDIIAILSSLKKKLAELLNEEVDMNGNKVNQYLKIVAIFEQFFRFIQNRKIDPKEIIGFNGLIKNKNIDSANEDHVEKSIENILNSFDKQHFINFKHIVDRRFADFKQWFFGEDKEDLKIVHDAIDYTLKSINDYNRLPQTA